MISKQPFSCHVHIGVFDTRSNWKLPVTEMPCHLYRLPSSPLELPRYHEKQGTLHNILLLVLPAKYAPNYANRRGIPDVPAHPMFSPLASRLCDFSFMHQSRSKPQGNRSDTPAPPSKHTFGDASGIEEAFGKEEMASVTMVGTACSARLPTRVAIRKWQRILAEAEAKIGLELVGTKRVFSMDPAAAELDSMLPLDTGSPSVTMLLP